MKKKNITKGSKNIYLIGGAVLFVLLLVLTIFTSPQKVNSEVITNEGIIIEKDKITKTATFIPFESNGTYMEIIAIEANDGSIRTALNTCQVCYNSGRGYYEQLGDVLICNNCGNQFTIDQIELVKGGCNPVPILTEMKTENDKTITIDVNSLVEFEYLFANWRR